MLGEKRVQFFYQHLFHCRWGKKKIDGKVGLGTRSLPTSGMTSSRLTLRHTEKKNIKNVRNYSLPFKPFEVLPPGAPMMSTIYLGIISPHSLQGSVKICTPSGHDPDGFWEGNQL